ncbi:hypothetical protein [Dyella subtropica]|uniref:hypothetical protein n=1 Tax=Dyella subtropica TaxID=2992127 RepID=UPI00225BA576|nr:hypothetical protein [Dyella subtropica]
MRKATLALFVLAIAVATGACHDMTQPTSKPVAGFVTDIKRFDDFIATHPTPDQFHATYPDVQLVMPGTMTTMEFRSNNSRYYPELDKDGHIVGGRFG